ncbi:protein Loquacious-like isoform X3 [Neodiprion pinetum]|uniref:RISC-loading complex subunit tarbp2 isoform X3 n=1 Tax=Neodiprion lecontei TaxID=441921 RepID=A0A6J0BG97_NEOLC|nr:RISC-loading complex subunit tarbp2 isoform X3 [Neodiprion lecontei]XP_046409904.1 RISC-loading complex subunit tarbp2-like isoform X3 [Neodiprion fabricii]XP_046466045.1 RISC-loading complex subunit tarbp2-like isoform X3 [Neodiprion pinetum]XP_046603760.1 RISC-loading complex subunit tarbp2-like isoform X3 [Neodiprion virginianus]
MDEMRHSQQVVPNIMSGIGVQTIHPNSVHRHGRNRVTMHTLMSEALPLDEAARLEMKAMPAKTPVSVLQELLSRRGTTPKYELVQIEGAIHEPTFRYRVTVSDVVDLTISAMGTGRSKKEAKHAAAKAVLDKLIGVNTETSEGPLPNSISEGQNLQELQNYGEDKVVGNPIGSLQEMCMSNHWPPPKYTMEGEEGLPHERQFTIVCSILKYRQVGIGKSKKLAKRQAADKMWRTLRDTPIENNQSPGIDDDENTCLNDGDINLVQFLQEIASEQIFEVTYVDIEEKSISGKCQCLVQLSTLPVAVCYGCGVTSKDAQASAAQNALEYLKIMTKK